MTWDARARAAMEQLIASDEPYKSDDLRDLAGDPDPDGTPNGANNKIGNLFREYSVAGRIEKVAPSHSESDKRKRGMNFLWQKKRRPKLSRKPSTSVTTCGTGQDTPRPPSRVRYIKRRNSRGEVLLKEIPVPDE